MTITHRYLYHLYNADVCMLAFYRVIAITLIIFIWYCMIFVFYLFFFYPILSMFGLDIRLILVNTLAIFRKLVFIVLHL